jgi:hypothetical protein
MKPLIAALLLALLAAPAMAGDAVDTTFVKTQGPHPFNVRDLVMMDRVSDPQLLPDGRYAAFGVRSTDYAANKGVNAIYVLDLAQGGEPVKVQDKASSARSVFCGAGQGCGAVVAAGSGWQGWLEPGQACDGGAGEPHTVGRQ